MNTCLTCRHWRLTDYDRYNSVIFPRRPGSYDSVESEAEVVTLFGHRVRRCEHPRVVFYQRPDADGAAVCDGSEHTAELITGERFGCVLHEVDHDAQ